MWCIDLIGHKWTLKLDFPDWRQCCYITWFGESLLHCKPQMGKAWYHCVLPHSFRIIDDIKGLDSGRADCVDAFTMWLHADIVYLSFKTTLGDFEWSDRRGSTNININININFTQKQKYFPWRKKTLPKHKECNHIFLFKQNSTLTEIQFNTNLEEAKWKHAKQTSKFVFGLSVYWWCQNTQKVHQIYMTP